VRPKSRSRPDQPGAHGLPDRSGAVARDADDDRIQPVPIVRGSGSNHDERLRNGSAFQDGQRHAGVCSSRLSGAVGHRATGRGFCDDSVASSRPNRSFTRRSDAVIARRDERQWAYHDHHHRPALEPRNRAGGGAAVDSGTVGEPASARQLLDSGDTEPASARGPD